MERNDLPEVLFEKMNEIVDYYPIQVKSVEGMLDQTGFFPGCRGLWQQVPSDEFPSILVLGHDFGNIKYYDDLVAGRQVDMAGNTFKNLITLFDEAGIKLSKCFFSNVIMGLRDTTDMTGKNPGNSDKLFMGKNLEFLAYQIETIKPKLIITMGQYATKMLGSLSIKDLKTWSDFKQWGDISKDGNSLIKENVNINNHICTCVAIEHTSFNRLNVIGKKYNRVKTYENQDAEVKMLEDVLASFPTPKAKDTAVTTSTINTKINSNAIAVDLVKQEFINQGFKVEPSKVKSSIANFNIVLDSGRTIQIKVRVITKMGSYVFNEKTKFDINDPDMYMALVYMPEIEADRIMYLIPAIAWLDNNSIFKGYDYNKIGQVSKPEWGITYSQNAKVELESYRFNNGIRKFI